MGAGYAQLRPSQNGVMPSNEPAVVYARINHGVNNTRLRPMTNEVKIFNPSMQYINTIYSISKNDSVQP